MSEVKVNKISPRTNCGTVTLGDSGDSFVIPSGATITNNGTQTGFGRTGTVDWVTTVQTSTITAATGKGYFVNTTGGAITANLPAGSAGSIVSFKDYAATFHNNNLTIAANGSEKINGLASPDLKVSTQGEALTLVYIDSTKGWLVVNDGNNDAGSQALFVTATGGNAVVTCGDFKTHIFTSPGTFCVSSAGGPSGSNTVDYVVVAGGAGSSNTSNYLGGGGAGGFRHSNSVGCIPAPSTSPLASPTGLAVPATGYPITVGAGGASPSCSPSGGWIAPSGANSVFSSITSAGGGGGANTGAGGPGGNGGGGSQGPTPTSGYAGGNGNTPPVSPPQGNNGGAGYDGLSASNNSGGGGGAGAVGANAGPSQGGNGGAGTYIAPGFIGPTAPTYGTPGLPGRAFAGGGGGVGHPGSDGSGGSGGGGNGGHPKCSATAGTANTGGGAGANSPGGGSGFVAIRYKYQ